VTTQDTAATPVAAAPFPPRLVWRCRRGMREMDLLLLGWLARHWGTAGATERATFEALLEEADHDILCWVLGRTVTPARYGVLISTLTGLQSDPDPAHPA